ncbi:MAG TPA: AmmeMemoRadiSam system radical SAM enzyme [Phycisphaerae bacterium]|nr:AmmeMemoRadiSam system radical SAM enzyme [Phycisphaerae bacterium]
MVEVSNSIRRTSCEGPESRREDAGATRIAQGGVGLPSRRSMLCSCAACLAGGAMWRAMPVMAEDTSATGELSGPKLKGVIRHKAMFWEPTHKESEVKCLLCPRECKVVDLERGYCGVRENQGGQYQTLVYGALCSANLDPIEKKPLFHYLPGSSAFSIATAGCNLECRFCQNWEISQFRPEQVESVEVRPERLVELVKARECPTIAYTYSEPTISYEYVHDTAALARQAGIGSVIISNGYMQEKPLRQLCRHLTAVKIDFKAFSQDFYAEMCSASLEPVLNTFKTLKNIGIWFELVVLIIPTKNDSADEIRQMSDWILKNLGPDVPVHFTRFSPTYRVKNLPPTPAATLDRCRKTALETGLHYVYVGNLPSHPGENTYCHQCKAELIRRVGYRIAANAVKEGKCPKCGTAIPGVWSQTQALAFKPRETRAEGAATTRPA